jgi:hypothetical protein
MPCARCTPSNPPNPPPAKPARGAGYGLDSTRLDSTRLDSTRLGSTRLDSTRLEGHWIELGTTHLTLTLTRQVGESSKLAGSGKIGRKGIGFKSCFQITDCPVVLSPPFQFCFNTAVRGIFGYIVPSWVETPEQLVPPRHQQLVRRLWTPDSSGALTVARTGTLLVCPLAARVRAADIMRDLDFDGLSLAFLKNLEQITFVSSATRSEPAGRGDGAPAGRGDGAQDGGGDDGAARISYAYRVERSLVFERGGDEPTTGGEALQVRDSAPYSASRLRRTSPEQRDDLGSASIAPVTPPPLRPIRQPPRPLPSPRAPHPPHHPPTPLRACAWLPGSWHGRFWGGAEGHLRRQPQALAVHDRRARRVVHRQRHRDAPPLPAAHVHDTQAQGRWRHAAHVE